MRKSWVVVLALFALPLLALAQYVELTPGYSNTTASYYNSFAANSANAVKLAASTDSFRLDSVKFQLYRHATTNAATLNYRVVIYSRNGSVGATCGCTTGPGTILRQYPSATGTYAATVAGTPPATSIIAHVLPPDTIVGPFIVGIVYISKSAGTYWPSILLDTQTGTVACCDMWTRLGTTWYDNDDAFGAGPWYISMKGTQFGALQPGHLTVSTLGAMGGALLDSTVVDTLVLGNSGGVTLTISSITSNRPAFTTGPVGAGIPIAHGATYKLPVYYTPTVAGSDTVTLTFTDNVPGSAVSTKTLWGRGITHTNTILYENWWNGNGYGGWPVYRFAAADTNGEWSLFYNGSHTDEFCNVAVSHTYTASGAPAVDDVILTPFLPAPSSHNIRLNWREETDYPGDVVLHGLVLADSDTNIYILDTLGLANTTQTWGDYPTTWYISGIDSAFSQFEVGFEYAGSYADQWYVDDILVGDVPQIPPTINSVEPHSDAFDAAHQLYCDVFDANSDPFTVVAHVTPNGGSEANYTLTETPANSGHYCVPFSAFLNNAGRYSYYLTANDANGSSRWPATGSYTFEVQSMTGAGEMLHHNGTWNNAHYYNNMASMDAERFTPSAYPYLLTGARVGVLNGWPDWAHQQIQVRVYADDGPGGLPGTLLSDQITGSISRECAGFGDTTYANHFAPVCFFPGGVTINSGTFYLAVKNPDDAVIGENEGWTLDTLGHGTTYYYDATTTTWSLQPDTNGTLMVSAIGFTPVTAAHLAVYPNATNTGVLVYNADVPGSVGAMPYPMNLYIQSSMASAPTLVPGGPFTTSPIAYTFPTPPAGALAFFSGTYLYGAISLSTGIPGTAPELPTSSLITPASSSVRVAAPVDATRWNSKAALPVRNLHAPSVTMVNNVTGESVVIPFSVKLGKPTSHSMLNMSRSVGPVRSHAKNGFEALQINN